MQEIIKWKWYEIAINAKSPRNSLIEQPAYVVELRFFMYMSKWQVYLHRGKHGHKDSGVQNSKVQAHIKHNFMTKSKGILKLKVSKTRGHFMSNTHLFLLFLYAEEPLLNIDQDHYQFQLVWFQAWLQLLCNRLVSLISFGINAWGKQICCLYDTPVFE